MQKQQTAVEWLLDNIHYLHSTRWKEIIEEAKEMEMEQIINAFWHGDNTDCISEQNSFEFAEKYYNETFKK
jgi:hypothetical protein